LTTRSNRVSGGHKPSKSARNPKTVRRKRPKYAKTASFDDVLKSCIGGHKPSKSARNPKHCAIAPKNGQNMRKRRVFTMHSNRILGVTNRQNRPGTLKLSQENGQNMRKRRVLMTRSNRVLGVTNRRNRPGTLKLCAIAHK
jgi:hypothetical protein